MSKISTRSDVKRLQDKLEDELHSHKAKLSGICPVRRRVYDNIFEEVIDQINDEIPELGQILMRVRDEHQMTIDAHRILKESSVTYGLEKQDDAEQRLTPLQKQIEELEHEKVTISNSISTLRSNLIDMNATKMELDKREVSKYEERIDYLQKQNNQLKHLISNYS